MSLLNINQDELKDIYFILNKQLDVFNSEFYFTATEEEEETEYPEDDEPFTLDEFMYYLINDDHIFKDQIQSYRDAIFKKD